LLLTVAFVLTAATFSWFGWIIYDANRDAKMFTDQVSRIEELRGVIVHLDEVLTMSAGMSVTTGDLQWEKRYRHLEPQLDTAIKEITKIGTGFDRRYVDQVFRDFQRFHRAEEYEGTGVGLAIVERIIHRHGGRVLADSSEGDGATFYFKVAGKTEPTLEATAGIPLRGAQINNKHRRKGEESAAPASGDHGIPRIA
jgi:Histidine kinase-, DNA gyrase B-, and HSP90-like ATPase